MDPDKWRSQRAWLESPIVRAVAAVHLVDLSPSRPSLDEAIEGLVALSQATVLLGPLGWTVASDRLSSETYAQAVALVDDPEAVDAVMAAGWSNSVTLRMSYGPLWSLYGPDEASIDLMIGRRPDGSGAVNGPIARLRRLVSFTLMDQLPDFTQYEQAVRDGGAVVMIRVRGDAMKRRALTALRDHGGHFINYYGRFATEELERWHGPEPDIPSVMRR